MASASSLETYTTSGGPLGATSPAETLEIDPEVAGSLRWSEGDVVRMWPCIGIIIISAEHGCCRWKLV